jgi:hypothetical protein
MISLTSSGIKFRIRVQSIEEDISQTKNSINFHHFIIILMKN